jgi:hypothetical protein
VLAVSCRPLGVLLSRELSPSLVTAWSHPVILELIAGVHNLSRSKSVVGGEQVTQLEAVRLRVVDQVLEPFESQLVAGIEQGLGLV